MFDLNLQKRWPGKDSGEEHCGLGNSKCKLADHQGQREGQCVQHLAQGRTSRKCWSPVLNPGNLLRRFIFSNTTMWKIRKQNQESQKAKRIYTRKRTGGWLHVGEKPGSVKEEERERRKTQRGMSFGERPSENLEHMK